MEIPKPDIIETNAVDGLTGNVDVDITYTSERKFAVMIPETDYNDCIIEVRASVFSDVRTRLKKTGSKFDWLPEVLLSVSSLCFGGWICYLQSNGTYTEIMKFVFGTLLFGIGTATVVGYAILRYIFKNNKESNFKDILNIVPDPEKAIKRES